MATTVVATGKIEIQCRKQQPIPEGWALDENGIMTTDANVAFDVQKLMPLGGSETTSGYKGIISTSLHVSAIAVLTWKSPRSRTRQKGIGRKHK